MKPSKSLVFVINDLSRYYAACEMWDVTAQLTKALQVAQSHLTDEAHEQDFEIAATLDVVLEVALNLAYATEQREVINALEGFVHKGMALDSEDNIVSIPTTPRRVCTCNG